MGLASLIAPVSLAAMFLKRPAGPIRKLISAGARSPETARRAAAVGIPREYVLRPYARLGVARRLDDGRWYVDGRRDRQVRVLMFLTILLLAGGLGAVVWQVTGSTAVGDASP
ncbi:MAG: hypothetical protein MK082_00895 [Phycisphaerales bacterium]|nr:hypothetical protein [Phycisphaerales bacterium]